MSIFLDDHKAIDFSSRVRKRAPQDGDIPELAWTDEDERREQAEEERVRRQYECDRK